ncbi:gonadotropin-releasing hormone receptor, partial [Biomphalaria pfeifferi]
MVLVKQQCLSNNGSSLFINVSQIDNSSTVLFNKSDKADSALRPDWEVSYELKYGPNVSCTTQQLELPRDLRFTEDTMISVVAYCCMFLMSLVGNIMVFTTLWGGRRSRVNMCILHLSVADLYVACVFLPLETTWHITVSWQAGDLAC